MNRNFFHVHVNFHAYCAITNDVTDAMWLKLLMPNAKLLYRSLGLAPLHIYLLYSC